MLLRYIEMQGCGNRILVVDQREHKLQPPSAEQVMRIANDDNAPDFDQIMWVSNAVNSGSIASYRVFNNDGSEVEQCGNGVRCVASLLSADAGDAFALDGPAGPIDVRMLDDGQVSVNMGTATCEASELPVAGELLQVSLVSIGNPHCVLRVADVATADVASLGPKIEHHARFPDRINVGFMQILDRHSIRLRVHERGVGETLACGTGACAAAVAGQSLGLLDEGVDVFLPGGQLMVSWRGGAAGVWLSGDAENLSEGSIDL